MTEDECQLWVNFLNFISASSEINLLMLVSFLYILQVTIFFLGTITLCYDWTLTVFPRCIWHKVEEAVLQNCWVFEGTFMYPTGTCKPSFQIKSSKKSNLNSGHKMCISKRQSFCLLYSISKRMKQPHFRGRKRWTGIAFWFRTH